MEKGRRKGKKQPARVIRYNKSELIITRNENPHEIGSWHRCLVTENAHAITF